VRKNRTVHQLAFFSQRVVVSWNELPEEVATATSINMFKNLLDRCNEWGNRKATTYKAPLYQVSIIMFGTGEKAVMLLGWKLRAGLAESKGNYRRLHDKVTCRL